MTTAQASQGSDPLTAAASEAIQAFNKLPGEIAGAVEQLLHRAHAADGPPPLEIDDDGLLRGDGVDLVPGTTRQQSLAAGLEHIEAVCWHWTDTRGCGAENLARRLLGPGRAASWHAVIDAAGHAVQSVSAKKGSWHVGSDTAALFRRTGADGTWEALTPAQRGSVRGWGGNSFMYGIELENAGEVRLVDGKWLAWPFAFGTKWGAPTVVPAEEVASDPNHPGRGHHAFTPAQIETAGRVLGALVRRYGLRRSLCAFGHCQIDPQRRTDPGPLWLGDPMPALGGIPTSGHLAALLDRVFGKA